MKLINILWLIAIVLIASEIAYAERTYTCNINEGLECQTNNCHEKYSNGVGGFLRGSNYGSEYWAYMRFDERTCNGVLEFENSSTKSSTFYWSITTCNTEPSFLRYCNTNTNGDSSIEYCADDSVLSSSSCTNTENNFESEQNRNLDCNQGADDWDGNECSGSLCSSPVSGHLPAAATNDNENYAVFFLDPSTDQTLCTIAGTAPYLQIVVDSKPELVGCPDDYTIMNSNGSDIFIDLWSCHSDTDDASEQNTFTIFSESNTALIDCSITASNHTLTCVAPATNKTGYSDIVVRVNDGYYTDDDTVRVYVNPKPDVSIYINNTEAWSGISSQFSDADILEELQSYLEVCKSDSKGNCNVPIKIKSNDRAVNFSINYIDIAYDLRELEFSNILQEYVNNYCVTSGCSIPIKLSLDSKGKLNISDLEVYYAEKQLEVSDLRVLYQNNTKRIFGFSIKNFRNVSLDSISWKLNTGVNMINSTINSTLQPEEDLFVYAYHNYTNTGQFTVTATVNRNTISDSESISMVV